MYLTKNKEYEITAHYKMAVKKDLLCLKNSEHLNLSSGNNAAAMDSNLTQSFGLTEYQLLGDPVCK
jgi:hypothetical protein